MTIKITVTVNSDIPMPPMTCDNPQQVIDFCERQSWNSCNAVIKLEGYSPAEEKTAYLKICKVLKTIPNLRI
jgi:hypothetical protein